MLLVILSTFAILAGLGLSAYGVLLACGRRRPIDLLGALLAAGGLAIAVLGASRLLTSGFHAG